MSFNNRYTDIQPNIPQPAADRPLLLLSEKQTLFAESNTDTANIGAEDPTSAPARAGASFKSHGRQLFSRRRADDRASQQESQEGLTPFKKTRGKRVRHI